MPKYNIIRKLRLKHTYIYIKQDGSVEIRTNYTTSKKSIEKLIQKKSAWIEKKLALMMKKNSLDKERFYLLGEILDKSTYKIASQKDLDILYKKTAIKIITPLLTTWSKKMNLYPTKVGFRKTKSRWGSCSHKNSLSFSTNLAKTHPDFIEYVVVHELAHIKHKNHSKEFWKEVEKYLPDYKERKKLII